MSDTRLKAAFRLLLPLVKIGPVNGVRIVRYQIFSESVLSIGGITDIKIQS